MTEEGKKLRNSEGEAQAQWREQDLDFGGKKKQMLGSDGQIISLEDQTEEKSVPFKSVIKRTEKTEEKYFMSMLSTDVTYYVFEICFGSKDQGSTWEIRKRYSEFDKIDNRLNDKFGLPPIGLPPKKWFGLSDPELIQTRHKMLNAYINDCLKRPVLIHSRDLQIFLDMPDEVVQIVTKGK